MTVTLPDTARHSVQFGVERIPFRLSFRARHKLAISVHPDRQVSVVAPSGSVVEDVLARVQRRAGWIAKQRAFFEQFHPLPPARRYVSGETHLFLGRQYRLKVASGIREQTRLVGRFLRVNVKDPRDSGRVKTHVDRWYHERARVLFSHRLRKIIGDTPSLRGLSPQLVVRTMGKRWGSCTSNRNILLNIALIRTPLFCIEYVMVHELCHLLVHNHGPMFFRLLDRCLPDWRKRKQRLETFVF